MVVFEWKQIPLPTGSDGSECRKGQLLIQPPSRAWPEDGLFTSSSVLRKLQRREKTHSETHPQKNTVHWIDFSISTSRCLKCRNTSVLNIHHISRFGFLFLYKHWTHLLVMTVDILDPLERQCLTQKKNRRIIFHPHTNGSVQVTFQLASDDSDEFPGGFRDRKREDGIIFSRKDLQLCGMCSELFQKGLLPMSQRTRNKCYWEFQLGFSPLH